jgi:hypothetical protein
MGVDMKVSSARRIPLWIGACWAAFVVILFIARAPDAGELLGQLLVVGGTIGGLFYLGYRFRVLPRRRSFQGQARELGLRPELGDTRGLMQLPFSLFRWMASARDMENTASGTWRGADIVVGDYWFARSGRPEKEDYERYTCVLTAAPSTWSDLSVVPERIASRLRGAIGLDDIEMESEQFNRSFEVRAMDPLFASAFVDARMMEWLLSQVPGVGFEVLGGRLLVFRPRMTASVDDLARALELLDAFLAHVPRVVADGGGYPMAGT